MKKLITTLLIIWLSTTCSTPKPMVQSADVQAQIHCRGNGKYTLLMDAGLGNWSVFYKPLATPLSKTCRVCLIDRAGYASSQVSAKPRDAKTIAIEIHQALQQKDITKNIILAGHSLGGLHVRMYQALFPEEIKGMILLDAANPNQLHQLPKAFWEMMQEQKKSLEKTIKLAQRGFLKHAKSKIPTFNLPDSLLEEYFQTSTKAEYYFTAKAETEAFEQSLKQVSELKGLGNLPLLVIGSSNSMSPDMPIPKRKNYPFQQHNKAWFELQQELSKLSSKATFVESQKDHYLHLTDTELVLKSILTFIDRIPE